MLCSDTFGKKTFILIEAIPGNWFRKRYHHEKPASSK
jgi:hypothetical protein